MNANSKPLILISNDDGYSAKGITALIEAVQPLGELIVMAPDGPRSGYAGSITTSSILTAQLVRKEDDLTVYKCSGTPVDCIKLALNSYVPRKPDLILGGINHGDNSSVNVHYSGTMGIPIEGCMKGVPSIGFSLCNLSWDADFSATIPIVRKLSEKVLKEGLPEGVCLNVNIPDLKEFKGVKVCRQSKSIWDKEYVEKIHPRGSKYYWLHFDFLNLEPDAEDTDRWALKNGYVSITPTKVDVTAYEAMKNLESFNTDF
ncbi:Acid phosphatase surE, putative [Trichomonas vaginalis G3]|uniref:Acid phosphatase surE, putative n=1 Tax=Trichomonas vaginalis (strain ATCC PRA-98 / G3) TaxID=412133 RepID=A2DUR7_TRIV3|nr:survival protein SurE family [Trichomonas vaginalis G3]EAY15802.1 Acid phosphatase surE, putative [Trichomonas vaginalis G3]KAI5525027.1 survival protein SurE family [Trichomonas vaginalis G3]|eukprot:XP_001328025.1 Acid phosphatase surE [Trichomonas vaginalis G3]